MTLGDVFDFNSEIACNLKLISLEEIYYDIFRLNFVPENNSLNKMRFEEIKSTTFEKLATNKNYQEEYQKIKKIIRKKGLFEIKKF